MAGFFRYIPPSTEAQRWGLQVNDCGWTHVEAGKDYPPPGHPAAYRFDPLRGRILTEGQFVYITRGGGTFWSEVTGERHIRAGDCFVLFPGIRHRYHPHVESGWDEHWIGLLGILADRFWKDLFDPLNPLIAVGDDCELIEGFQFIYKLVEHQSRGFQSLIAAKGFEIAVRVHARALGPSSSQLDATISRVCRHFAESLEQPIDLPQYAISLHMSYSTFRRSFKQQTGLAPNQYLLDLRIQRSRQLLQSTSMSIQAISDACGFDGVAYFSRYFRKRVGVSPSQYRRRLRS